MTTEVYPSHLRCNIDCEYCYQKFVKDAGNLKQGYDFEKIKGTLKKADDNFVLSGGEPLLTPKNELEKIWKWGYEKYGCNGLQTNGILIDEDHIEMFEKYNVSVSVSIDGPGKLNSLRRAGSKSETRKNTKKIMNILEKLLANEKIDTGVIITLHRANAGSDSRLEKLKDFFLWLKDRGLYSGYLHFLIKSSDNYQQDYTLAMDQYEHAFLQLAEFMENNKKLSWKPFTDIKNKLSFNRSNSICIWNNCDPFTTRALSAIHIDGSVCICSQLYKEGFEWEKSAPAYYERYLSLYQTPQDLGGCKDCRFFLLCGGSCPARGGGHDWRNKASDCSVIKNIFGFYEAKLEEEGNTPFSRRDDLAMIMEKKVKAWKDGRDISLQWIVDENKENEKHPGISANLLQTPGKKVEEDNRKSSKKRQNNSLTKQDVKNGNWSPANDHSDNEIHIDNSSAHIDSKAS